MSDDFSRIYPQVGGRVLPTTNRAPMVSQSRPAGQPKKYEGEVNDRKLLELVVADEMMFCHMCAKHPRELLRDLKLEPTVVARMMDDDEVFLVLSQHNPQLLHKILHGLPHNLSP